MKKYKKCSNISNINLITREISYECSILIFIVPSTGHDVEAVTNGDSSK